MKKLITLLCALLVQTAAVMAQTSFKEETLTDVKVKDGKVYYYKNIVSDSVLCGAAGTSCVIGRTTTLKAEIFEIDPLLVKFDTLKKQALLDLYQKRVINKFLNPVFDEWVYPNKQGHLLAYFHNYHEYMPVLNKISGKIEARKINRHTVTLNTAIFVFLFANLMIFFGLSNYRRKLFFKKNDFAYTKQFNISGEIKNIGFTNDRIASVVFGMIALVITISAFYAIEDDYLKGQSTIDLPFYLLVGLYLILQIIPFKFYSKVWGSNYSFIIEFLSIHLMFLLVNKERINDLFPTFYYYEIILFFIMLLLLTRFYKKINNETIWETMKFPEFGWFITENFEKVRQKWVKFKMRKF